MSITMLLDFVILSSLNIQEAKSKPSDDWFRHLVDNIVFTTGKTRYLVYFSLQSRQLNTWLALQIKCNSYFIPSLNQPDDVHNEWTLMTIVLARQHWRAFLMFLSSDSQGNNKEAYLLRKNITSAPVARYVLSHASPVQYIPSCTIRKIVRVNMSRLTLQKEGREEFYCYQFSNPSRNINPFSTWPAKTAIVLRSRPEWRLRLLAKRHSGRERRRTAVSSAYSVPSYHKKAVFNR